MPDDQDLAGNELRPAGQPDVPGPPHRQVMGAAADPNSLLAAQFTAEYLPAPFIPPNYLREYESVSPGAAKEFIGLIRSQVDHANKLESDEQAHRHKLEEREATAEEADRTAFWDAERRAQLCAAGVAFGVIVLGGYVAYAGAPSAAATIVCVTLAAVIIAFLVRRSWHRSTEAPMPIAPPPAPPEADGVSKPPLK